MQHAMTPDRCSDCHYRMSAHFEVSGRSLGCPVQFAGNDEAYGYPRIIIRIGKRPERRDHVLVIWADLRDEDRLLWWDRETGEQFWAALCPNLSKPSSLDVSAKVKEDIEYEIGGRVRVVKTTHPRAA